MADEREMYLLSKVQVTGKKLRKPIGNVGNTLMRNKVTYSSHQMFLSTVFRIYFLWKCFHTPFGNTL